MVLCAPRGNKDMCPPALPTPAHSSSPPCHAPSLPLFPSSLLTSDLIIDCAVVAHRLSGVAGPQAAAPHTRVSLAGILRQAQQPPLGLALPAARMESGRRFSREEPECGGARLKACQPCETPPARPHAHARSLVLFLLPLCRDVRCLLWEVGRGRGGS